MLEFGFDGTKHALLHIQHIQYIQKILVPGLGRLSWPRELNMAKNTGARKVHAAGCTFGPV
jgi:hypothetical protein